MLLSTPHLNLTYGLTHVDVLHQVTAVPASFSLAHEEGPKVAGPPVHLHGAGVADGDEEAVSGL